jgi:peptidoglycan hydrolase CwlO-like protein
MKKKIINGILMVALVGATSTSFVSCKDTSEDVKTDLMAQVNAVKANLEPRVEQAEKDIDALEVRATDLEKRAKNLEDSVASHRTEINGMKDEIGKIKNRVSKLEEEKDSLADVTKTIEGRLDVVEGDINKIVDALKNMVTSVTVNATSTSILQNSKIFPGINMQFLGAAYGQATANGDFPSAEAADYVKYHGVALTAADIKGAEQISWEAQDFLPIAKGGKASAGTVYFTLNPSNVRPSNLDALTLINSQNEESFVTIDLDEVKASDAVLTWGATRTEYENTLWEAPAIINLKDQDLATIDPTKIVDFKAVASDVRSILSEAKQAAQDANRSNYVDITKSTTKSILKSSAQIVASLLNAKLPELPALAMAAQWTDTVGTRSVLSDYSIAATAYKPLSFTFGNDLIDGRQVNLDKVDNLVARILNKIKNKVNSIGINNITIANITLSATDLAKFNKTTVIAIWESATPGDFVISLDDTTAPDGTHTTLKTSTPVDADMTAAVNSLLAEVNGSLNGANADIQAIINEIKSLQAEVTKYADKTQSFEVRVSNFLEREINRVITKVATDGLTRILEPIILFQAGDNYSVTRFFDGQNIPAGKITLVPTTMTYELLAPAYKKYVAIKKADGSFAFQKVLTKGDKDFSNIVIDNLAAGNYTVIYSAVDFSGNQIAKKYNVTVK